MARRHKDDGISSPAEKAIISQFPRNALRQVNPDGSKPQLIGAGKGWQGGVIAATGPANPDQQVLTRDDSLPRPTKSSVLDPTRLLKQYKQATVAPQTQSPPPPPPPANHAQEPSRAPVPVPAAPPSMSPPAPHRTVSKHAPPPSPPAPRIPPTTTMSTPSSAWAPSPAQQPLPAAPHLRPPVENGSAWKDYEGDQPADTVQPIRNWAQGRSDFAAKNKFKAPPVRSPGYGGTTTHTTVPSPVTFSTSSVQRPSLPSMPPSMTTTARKNAGPSSSSSWNAAGSKVASLAHHRGGGAAAAAAAARSPSMVAENGTVAGPTKSTPNAKTATTSTTNNETHLSKWATKPAATTAAPSPSPATATASTGKEAPPAAASPTPAAATAPPPPSVAAPAAVDSISSSSPSSSSKVPVEEETKDDKAVPHLTINGIAAGSGSGRSSSSSTASTSSALPTGVATPARTATAGAAAAAALPPPVPSTSTTTTTPASALKMASPSKTTAAFIASATAAAPSNSAPSPQAATSPTASSFKLNGAAVDFEMPAKKEYRAPDWVEKPQERTHAEEMGSKFEKLSISTPVQKRVQRDETRATRSPRGSPMLPPADRARLASGGPQRVKKTPEEIEELMARMKLKNEETRKRVEAVEKDRARYDSAQAEQYERASSLQRRVDEQRARVDDEEQAKRERTAALQKSINEERERTAAAKLRAKSGRAWDAGKVPPSSSSGRAASPTPAPAVSYPSVEAEAREARRRRAEENHEQRVSPPAREITEEEAERIRRRDGVRGDDGGWETVVHHEGTGRAETVVR